MLIALDRSDDCQREQEFEYMWSDARLKARNKEEDGLSDDQKMLCQVSKADEAYNLYWPWTEEPDGLQSMRSQTVGQDSASNTHTQTHAHARARTHTHTH